MGRRSTTNKPHMLELTLLSSSVSYLAGASFGALFLRSSMTEEEMKFREFIAWLLNQFKVLFGKEYTPPTEPQPIPPVEPEHIPEPNVKAPLITDMQVLNDATLLRVIYESETPVGVATSGGDLVANGMDDDSPSDISVSSGLAKGFEVIDGKFQGDLIVTLSNAGGSDTKRVYVAPTVKPVEPPPTVRPPRPQLTLPFKLQGKGETPRLIRSPDEIFDVTDLGLGSNKEPNHPSFEVFNKAGTHGIFGSAKAIIDVTKGERVAGISGSGNVMWSRVEPDVLYAVLNDGSGIDRYSNYGKTRESFITARQLGLARLETKSEGPFISDNDAFLFCRATDTGVARFMVFIDMTTKRVDRQWPVSNTNFDCWGISPSGRFGVLDTLPANTRNGRWMIYDRVTGDNYATEPIGTKHFTTVSNELIDVNGVTVNLLNGKHSKPLAGLGHGVSNAQHINAMNNINALVWTQGSKGASRKQIDLVSLDGKSFAYLMEVGGGVYGGEIYASGWSGDGVFKLAFVDGDRTKVAVWR